MLQKPLIVLACLLVLMGSAFAQAQPAPPKPAESSLAPLAWLVGGTWTSDVKDPQDGSVTHVENRITWAPNHQGIQFVTDFNGKPHYNGFYAYNPVAKTIGSYYTNTEGDLAIGTCTADADGKTLHQEFDMMKAGGTTQRIRSTMLRDGDNAYDFTAFLQSKTGDWVQVLNLRYQRK